MCGFIGFTRNCNNKEEVLKEMLGTISHRGPDSEDSYIDDDISIGFRRLSIIDLSGGTQPIYNEDKTKVLVFNGEIYNYQILRDDLVKKGHIFYTHTDSEVLIHGYEEYGKDLLDKLRGMFSFIIWDKTNKKIFGARDFFGIKPMYYAEINNTFFFGSEIKGFLPHPNFKKELNEDKISDYMTWSCIPGYETFFKNVFKLPPGHYFEYDLSKNTEKLKINKYFTVSFDMDENQSLEYFKNKIRTTLEKSVIAHKISDVEVGCFLSAGVDSSIVAYELSKLGKVKTFTIGFDDKRYSEDQGAKDLAEEIGVSNEVKMVTSDEYFKNIGKVQYHLDEPLANPSANLLYFLSELAHKKVKVVLSGEGADEMFGGYNVYKEPLSLKNYQKIPYPVRVALAYIFKILPNFKGKNFIIRGSQTIEERYIGNSNIFNEKEKDKILKKKITNIPPQKYTKPFYDNVKGLGDMTKMQYLDIHMWMVQEILLKADKMSMANSLELRVPFLDTEIFKVARTIPEKYKVSKINTKLALRAVAAEKINLTSANRKKMAFPLPLVEWLREDVYNNQVREYFTNKTANTYFNQDEIVHLLEEHKKGKINNARKIWTILSFLVWYEEFFVKR
jgi:asparagine synthase (glutamine-hydrolysing)